MVGQKNLESAVNLKTLHHCISCESIVSQGTRQRYLLLKSPSPASDRS
ncbi:hypothetical protein GXM_10334 [Nostoc sphaeroides CCNUC1]|uniref:Uncharacterized protein n=1 Tax=Nostoc sphaeroides CCNUC1 TaxID=2653204 RepID=A0A5P8WL25_9NOSO|nr:hypothetical protein GXM_10334 [Nostoc sphaeroides CCNUC1]